IAADPDAHAFSRRVEGLNLSPGSISTTMAPRCSWFTNCPAEKFPRNTAPIASASMPESFSAPRPAFKIKSYIVSSKAPNLLWYVPITLMLIFLLLLTFYNYSLAHSSAYAECGQAIFAFPLLHFIKKRYKYPCPRASNRMSKSYCSSIDIYCVRVEPEVFYNCERLGGKGFICLYKIHVVYAKACNI